MNIEINHQERRIRLTNGGVIKLADLADALPRYTFSMSGGHLIPETTWLRRFFAWITRRQHFTGPIYTLRWNLEIRNTDIELTGGHLEVPEGIRVDFPL